MKNKLHSTVLLSVLFLFVVSCFVFKNNISDQKEIIVNEKTERKEMEKRSRVKARAQHEFEMTKDPQIGTIPRERLWEAQRYVTQLLEEKEEAKGQTRSPIENVNWISKGPNNVGGRTRAILFDPTDTSHKRVFAGGVSGGLWKNEDITTPDSPWTQINDFFSNLAIVALVHDPNNTSTWYMATGEAYSSVVLGNGVYKTTDAGVTWTHLSSTTDHSFITSMVVRNEGGTSVIYMGGKEKRIGDELEGSEFVYKGKSGLWRSADAGTTWVNVVPVNDDNTDPTIDHVIVDGNNDLWATTGTNSYDHKGGDILYCTSGCNTSPNWQLAYDASAQGHSNVDRTIIASAPSDPNKLYAIAGRDGAGEEDVVYFIKSIDNGFNWTNLSIPKRWEIENCTPHATKHFTNGQATYDLCMTVHPNNSDLVLLGGIDMYRTTDGFNTTSHISSWYKGPAPCDKDMHADHHFILFRPGLPNEIVFGNDGGVYYSADAGNASEAAPTFLHQVKDYNVTQLYAVDIHPTSSTDKFLAGAQDNGTQWFNESPSSSEAEGGDGGFCHIDQNEPDIQIASYIYNDYVQTNNSWTSKQVITPSSQTGRFTNPTAYDFVNNILYGASSVDKISRVTNIGSSTPVVTDGIAVNGAALGGEMATTLRVSRNTVTTLYLGTNAGKVFKITNANSGASVISTDISTGLPTGWVSSIDIEKGDENHLLVTLSNYGLVSVWESINGGTSWNNIEGNLPDMPVRWGIFSPLDSTQVFLATELGVWSTNSLDGMNTDWDPTNSGLANVRVDMIRYRYNNTNILRSGTLSATLVAATHGRGIFTTDIISGTVLSVELEKFTAEPKEKSILLQWETLSETNNSGFEIYRRTSTSNRFELVDWVEGSGNSSEKNNYTWEDFEVSPGASYYYQLKQIDFDGTYSFSPVKEAKIAGDDEISVSIFPNPAGDFTTIDLGASLAKGALMIYDQKGRLVRQQKINDSVETINLDLSPFSKGLYYISIIGENNIITKRVVKN